MPITQQTPLGEIDAYVEERVKLWKKAMVRLFAQIGEECRNAAILCHRYKNQTRNLESSTGYVIVDDGHVVKTGGFSAVLDGAEGAKEGKKYIKTLVGQFSTGLCLIVVAGMKYAAYVSDMGLDVLDSAELTARRLIPRMLEQLEL